MPNIASALALDGENHDLYLDENHQIAFITDTASRVAQAIRCRLQTVKGELYQQPDIGVPLFTDVLVKNPNLVTLQHLFTTIIAGVPEVKSVTRVDLSLDGGTRTLTVAFAAVATDGTSVTGSI